MQLIFITIIQGISSHDGSTSVVDEGHKNDEISLYKHVPYLTLFPSYNHFCIPVMCNCLPLSEVFEMATFGLNAVVVW